MSIQSELTKHPPGSFREFISVVTPIILSGLSVMLLGFCDSIFLANSSINAWETVTASQNIFHFFQNPVSLIILIAHPFISGYLASDENKKVGPLVWQMIYFSFIFALVVLLLFPLTKQYLWQTEIQEGALEYLGLMVSFFFLFPLGTALSTFHLGCNKQTMILRTTVVTQLVNIVLDYLFIFGAGPIPALGIKGAATATLISQAIFCIVLFLSFISKDSRQRYNTSPHSFQLSLVWPVLRKGVLRSTFSLISLGGWLMGSRFLITAGGDYLLVLAFSGTVITIIYSFLDSFSSATVTIASNIAGSKRLYLYRNLLRNSFWFGGCFFMLFSLGLALFQDAFIALYIKYSMYSPSIIALKQTVVPLVLVCAASTFAKLVDGILIALKRLWVFAISCSIYSILIYVIPLTAFTFSTPYPSMIVYTVAFVKATAAIITFVMVKEEILGHDAPSQESIL